MTPWWSGLVGVVIGFGLSIARDLWKEFRQRRALWQALATEADLCSEFAGAYLDAQIAAPLFRIPTVAYETVLPKLIDANQIGDEELRALYRFYMEVEQFNRGLDAADEARGTAGFGTEWRRVVGKATNIREKHPVVRAIVRRKLREVSKHPGGGAA